MLGKHNKESVGSVAELLPTISPEIQERRLDISHKRSSSSLASTLLVILSIIFAVSALKQICDLREQNLSLMQQLAFERQKVLLRKMRNVTYITVFCRMLLSSWLWDITSLKKNSCRTCTVLQRLGEWKPKARLNSQGPLGPSTCLCCGPPPPSPPVKCQG